VDRDSHNRPLRGPLAEQNFRLVEELVKKQEWSEPEIYHECDLRKYPTAARVVFLIGKYEFMVSRFDFKTSYGAEL